MDEFFMPLKGKRAVFRQILAGDPLEAQICHWSLQITILKLKDAILKLKWSILKLKGSILTLNPGKMQVLDPGRPI